MVDAYLTGRCNFFEATGSDLSPWGPSSATSPVELQEVMRGADQGPLALHLLDAAEQKGPKASPLFDLTEGWLHDGLPPPVDGAALLSGELPSHLLLMCLVASWPAAWSGGILKSCGSRDLMG